jgi:Icc protein
VNSTPVTIAPADPDCIRLIQITDPHVQPVSDQQFKGLDTAQTLEQVIAAINAETEQPDLILATGDLAHDPIPMAYVRLRAILAQSGCPVFCLPGNHDHPVRMHHLLNHGRISTAKNIHCGDWQIMLLDSVVEGSEHGRLSDDEFLFVRRQLQCSTDRHVLIAVHHHPVDIGSPWMDAMKLSNGDEFLALIQRFPQVRCVIWGHIHQDFRSQLGDIQLIGSPSTCLQFKPNTLHFEKDELPPAYRKLTLWRDGRITTSLRWLEQPLPHDSVNWD